MLLLIVIPQSVIMSLVSYQLFLYFKATPLQALLELDLSRMRMKYIQWCIMFRDWEQLCKRISEKVSKCIMTHMIVFDSSSSIFSFSFVVHIVRWISEDHISFSSLHELLDAFSFSCITA